MLFVGFLGSSWAAFNGPDIPQNVPFTTGGKTYVAYVQAYHPYYGQSQICYYTDDYNQSYAPVVAKSGVIYGGLVNVRVLLNPASFNQAWDSESYYSTNVLCQHYYSGGWQGSLAAPSGIVNGQYNWSDWYYLTQSDYGLSDDLVRSVGIDVKVNETFNFNGQFNLGSLTSADVVVTGLSIVPSAVLSPVSGQLETKRYVNSESCSSPATKWCFYQHQSGAHTSTGGVGTSNDVKAWDVNLNYPNYDTDNGVAVYAIESGVVETTYAGATNAGGTSGQLLIRHTRNGNKWWSGYLHLTNIQVGTGNSVTTGTLLGYISNVGTDNNHLHFVVYKGDSNASTKLISVDTSITER